MKTPGPDHPIAIDAAPGRVIVRAGGRVVADTRAALSLREACYPAVQYIPRKDIDMSLLARSEHATYCPYKGDCVYYSLADVPNAAWTYEPPYPAVSPIAGYLAFYPNRVDSIEIG